MNIRLPRFTSLLYALLPAVGLLLASSWARADFIINAGIPLNFSDQPLENSNDGGNLSIENSPSAPTIVTFVSPGLVGGNLSISGTSVVNFPSTLPSDMISSVVGGDVIAYDSSTVNLAGGYGLGTIGGNLYAHDSSTVNVSQNGSVHGADLYGSGSSTTNMSGGLVTGNVFLQDYSILNLSGGSIAGDVFLQDYSILNLSGGSISGGNLFLDTNSVLNVFGSVTVTGDSGDFTLRGTLSDGTDLGSSGLEVFAGSNPINVTAVPGPSGLVLFLVGSCFLLGWRAASRLPRVRCSSATASA